MGVKFRFIVCADGDVKGHLKSLPVPDWAASKALAEKLFRREMTCNGTTTFEIADPRGKDVLVGVYPGVTLVAAEELGIGNVSQTDPRLLSYGSQAGRVIGKAVLEVLGLTAALICVRKALDERP